MLYLQFLCGGGQLLLQRQSDRLLASRSQRSESKLSGHYCIVGNFERFNFHGCMIFTTICVEFLWTHPLTPTMHRAIELKLQFVDYLRKPQNGPLKN